MNKNDKRFIVRKYIMARSALDAIRKEKIYPVDDVWVDEDWKKQANQPLTPAIGFHADPD